MEISGQWQHWFDEVYVLGPGIMQYMRNRFKHIFSLKFVVKYYVIDTTFTKFWQVREQQPFEEITIRHFQSQYPAE